MMFAREVDQQLRGLRPFVVRQAQRLMARLPTSIEKDDLIQVGMIAVWKCLDSFDPDQGVPFEQYAIVRVRGAMKDELRGYDQLSRDMRWKLNKMAQVETEARAAGVPATVQLIAEKIDVAQDTVRDLRLIRLMERTVELDDTHDAVASNDDVVDQVDFKRNVQRLYLHLDRLPPKQLELMNRLYSEGLRQIDVALEWGCTESNVSITRRAAMENLARGFNQHDYELRDRPVRMTTLEERYGDIVKGLPAHKLEQLVA